MKIYRKDRSAPVRLFDDPSELDGLESGDAFSFSVLREEYYVVQLLMCDCSGPYDITVTGLEGRATVYNTQGIDKFGRPFLKEYRAQEGQINPVYAGFDFSGLSSGAYSAVVHFSGAQRQDVTLTFHVQEQAVEDHGYGDLWRLARLNWLNSTRAQDHDPVPPFTRIEVHGSALRLLGREITLGADLQIRQMESFYDEGVCLTDSVQLRLLRAQASFRLEGETFTFQPPTVENLGDTALLCTQGESARLHSEVALHVKCEGCLEYFITLTAREDLRTQVTFTLPFRKAASRYNMGLGKPGGNFQDIHIRWDGLRHDSLYTGTINAGAMVRLKAEHYRTPLINVYYHNLPIIRPTDTWDNDGRGTILSRSTPEGADFIARTGEMALKKGEKRVFRYEIFLTPFKPIDYARHYATRYYQSYHLGDEEYQHLKKAEKAHLNFFNVHHGNSLHPYINYPFIETQRLKRFIDTAAQKGIGVKVYYTAREMSNHTAELFCYKALGNEILFQQSGQGLETFRDRAWLRKYFGEKIIPAWQVHYKSGPHKGDDDIAFIIQPDSRIENYYIEGLQWLVDRLGIKGIYIDDTSLDDTTLRRARKILNQTGGLIDMHMWNHEEDRAGDCPCMNIYMGILPFLDSLWIGEGFDCRKLSPDFILTEVSGLPFGNMSEMLEGGGDLYAGMLYGMSNRYGWHVFNTDRIHRVWDRFGIGSSRMLGYWDSRCPIHTDNPEILVTVYEKADALLVAVYNFSNRKKNFHYHIDTEKMPFSSYDLEKIHLSAGEGWKISQATRLDRENGLPARDGVLFCLRKKEPAPPTV